MSHTQKSIGLYTLKHLMIYTFWVVLVSYIFLNVKLNNYPFNMAQPLQQQQQQQQQQQEKQLHDDKEYQVEVEILKSVAALNDRSTGMLIFESRRCPIKLYGRDKELEDISTTYQRFLQQQLRQLNDRNTITNLEFILIHGANGTGKTALVEHCFVSNHRPNNIIGDDENDEGCFCVTGVFDQQIHLQKPNAAFIDLLTSYVDQIKDRSLVDTFRNLLQLSPFTSDEINSLVHMIPKLDVLFDRSESCSIEIQQSDVSINESIQNPISNDVIALFKYALVKFLRAVATSTYPIVLVLEDIHRADESALNLILFLLNHMDTGTILFVGTTRDDVDCEGLDTMLRKVSSEKNSITHVRLQNLDPICATTMISEILGIDNDNLPVDIMEIVIKQSMCNPFSIVAFLSALIENGCLFYEASSERQWQFSSNQFQQFNNKTIYDVISDQLALLPVNVIQLLRFATFLGTKIDLEILSYLMNEDQPMIQSYLNDAASKGYICTNTSGDFTFAHEFIIDTLRMSFQEAERQEFHYRIGRRLWQCYDLEKLDENIFVVVAQLLMGEQLIVKERERLAVARLCLRSGEQFVRISSFRSAFTNVMSGIHLLDKSSWRDEYQLTLDLHNAAAELAYCTGKGSKALEISNIIGANARCLEDALTGHDIKIRALGAVGKVHESIDFGLKILLNLGESFPVKPSLARCYIGLKCIRKRVKGRTSESLLRLRLMDDRRKTAAVTMMNQLFTVCLQVRPLLAPLLAFRVISLTIDYGISATSCLGFVTLGAILAGPAQEIEEGYRVGQVGMAMYEKFKIRVWLAPLSIMYYMGIHLFKHVISSALEPLWYAAQIGYETGNIEESIVCELTRCFLQLDNRSLLETLSVMCELQKKMTSDGLTTLQRLSTPTLQSLQTLIGIRNIDSLTKYEENDGLIFIFCHFHIMMLSFIFGDITTAATSSKHLRSFSAFPFGGVDAAIVVFFDGLVAIRHARKMMKRRNIRYGMNKVRQLKVYAEHAPHLFLCRLHLLEAEMASIKGYKYAHSKYVSAIALAKDCGNLTIIAIANELAGQYFLHEKPDLPTAKKHFQEAIHYYDMWGASAKVAQLTLEVERIFG